MPEETMTAWERMEAAVKLKPLDRIPCAPLMDIYFPARYKGIPIAEAMRDWKKGFYSIVDIFEEVSGWDGMILPGYSIPATPHVYSGIGLGKNLFPGQNWARMSLSSSRRERFSNARIMTILSTLDGIISK